MADQQPPSATKHDDGLRLQALDLVKYSLQPKIVQGITSITISAISKLKKKTRERGYNPQVSKKLYLSYVTDVLRSRRPPLRIESEVVNYIVTNRATREATLGKIILAIIQRGL